VNTQAQLVQTEKMASLGQLVAGVAHEINTPIGAINSMHNSLMRAVERLSNTLKEKYPDEIGDGSDLQKYLKIIAEANRIIASGTERVTTIVRRLRSFARLDEAELKTCNIHEGLEDTLTLIHHEVKHHIEIVRDYGDLPEFSCYPGRMNQVFLNILNNARQAIREKGRIEIKTYLKDNHAHIEISDNGVGISKQNLKKIFDPGFTTKGVGVGTGLGLSICYQIISGHYGDIAVQSELGKGTTFTIKLPLNLDEILEAQRSNN
jgi:signal transduction histidine kinase